MAIHIHIHYKTKDNLGGEALIKANKEAYVKFPATVNYKGKIYKKDKIKNLYGSSTGTKFTLPYMAVEMDTRPHSIWVDNNGHMEPL